MTIKRNDLVVGATVGYAYDERFWTKVIPVIILSQEPHEQDRWNRYRQPEQRTLIIGTQEFNVTGYSVVKRGPGKQTVLVAKQREDGTYEVSLAKQQQLYPDAAVEQAQRDKKRAVHKAHQEAEAQKHLEDRELEDKLETVLGIDLYGLEYGRVKIDLADLQDLAIKAGYTV